MKNEKIFLKRETQKIELGESVILVLQNGDRVKTSPVTDFLSTVSCEKIITKNTIYYKYN